MRACFVVRRWKPVFLEIVLFRAFTLKSCASARGHILDEHERTRHAVRRLLILARTSGSCRVTVAHKWCFCGTQNTVKVILLLFFQIWLQFFFFVVAPVELNVKILSSSSLRMGCWSFYLYLSHSTYPSCASSRKIEAANVG